MADRPDTPPRGYTTQDLEARPAPRRGRHTLRKILAFIVVTPILLVALWLAIALNWSYSSGERGGYVQKFSRKGWLCKTWEGELAMANLPGAMQQLFDFSVRDEAVARQIEQAVTNGERVGLHYEQHKGVPTNCFGETEYWVTKIYVAPGTGVPGMPGMPAAPAAPTPGATPTPTTPTTPPTSPAPSKAPTPPARP